MSDLPPGMGPQPGGRGGPPEQPPAPGGAAHPAYPPPATPGYPPPRPPVQPPGYPPAYPYPPAPPGYGFMPVARPGNGMAVAGFVFGLLSVILSFLGLVTLVEIILAIVFSSSGIGRANRGAAHRGLAIAGLLLGIVGAVFYLLFGLISLGAGWLV